MAQQSSGIPDMSALLGRPLTLGEERTLWHSFEERLGIDTETARLKVEQQKLLHEGEKLKQSLLARAIESMTPGWERDGQRVDVGGFSRGGAPMQQVAVGPGQPGREITPATGPEVQYRQPGAEQQRMGQQLARQAMGLTPEDPMEVFDRKIREIGHKEFLRGQEARKTEEFRVGQETKREEAGLKKLGVLEASRAAAAEKAQLATEAKSMKLKFEDVLTGVHKEYTKQKNAVEADLTKTADYRNAALEDLKDSYLATLKIVKARGEKHGIPVDIEEFEIQRDPSVLSRRQLDRYKAANKKQKRAFAKWYEETHGKPLDIKVE